MEKNYYIMIHLHLVKLGNVFTSCYGFYPQDSLVMCIFFPHLVLQGIPPSNYTLLM